MIKDIVVALLTTTINRYSDLKCDRNLIPVEMVIKDLTVILDYVADISEEDKEHITVILNSSELQNLKRENKVLEEHKMQAFKYQQQLICKIEELKKRENECLEGKVKFLQRR